MRTGFPAFEAGDEGDSHVKPAQWLAIGRIFPAPAASSHESPNVKVSLG